MENMFQKAKKELLRMEGTVNSCPFRTRSHIMPPVGWINDPNGLCQFRGVFHAYFQYSPLNVHGGGGYWGHCVSEDLLHWEYKEPVLTTDIPEDRSGVYSGSALIENDRMYLFYTGNVKKEGDYDYIDAGRISSQIMVESEDGQKMSKKQVVLRMEDYPEDITQHVRDPKVWKENGWYYMVLGARARAWDENGERQDRGGVLIYRSADRTHWTFHREYVPEKQFGYMWECPDLFTLNGKRILSFCPQGLESKKERYQNIYQSGYAVTGPGSRPEDDFREWDMGFDFYAPQTFQAEDGRRILIGWAGMPDTEEEHKNLSVEHGWQHCLTVPCELTLQDDRVLRKPVREIGRLPWKKETLDGGCLDWAEKTVKLTAGEIGGEACAVRIGSGQNALSVRAAGNRVELSFLNEENIPARCGGGRGVRTGRTEKAVERLLILIDSSIAEVFVNDGEIVFTTRIYLEREERSLKVSGGAVWEAVAI